MPKSRRSHQTKYRVPAPREKDVASVLRRLLRGFWIFLHWLFGTLFGWAIVVATLLGFLALMPNVTLQPPSEGVDPLKPFHAPFVITNASSIPVYSVTVYCKEPGVGIHQQVQQEGSLPEHPIVFDVKGKLSVFSTDRLAADSETFQCDNFSNLTVNGRPVPANRCDVMIQVKMRILHVIPWSIQSDFVGELGDDSLIHWKFKPVQEKGN